MKKIEKIIMWAVVIATAIAQAVQYIIINAPVN